MKALRQILRVMAKKANLWVLEQAGVNRSLLANVKSRKLRYFGHIMKRVLLKGPCPGIEKEEDRKQCG